MRKSIPWLAILAVTGFLAIPAQAQPSVQPIVTEGLSEPYDVTVDAANNYYVSDSVNNRIVRYNPNSGQLATFAGTGNAGVSNGQALLSEFWNPQGIIFARDGLVVADAGNHLIRFISLDDGTVSTLAGSTQGYNDSATPEDAQFNSPAGLAADSAGNIYVADTLNNRIRRIDAATDEVTTVAAGFNFQRPTDVTIDEATDTIYVADTGAHVIRVIRPDESVEVFAGRPGVSGDEDSLLATQATFNAPRGLLWVGGKTGLLISDTGNETLRRVYFDVNLNAYSVEHYADTPDSPLQGPVGLSVDTNGNFPLADLAGDSLVLVRVTEPQAPVSDPTVGVVNLVTTEFGDVVTVLNRVIDSTFHNDVMVAIRVEQGATTYYTFSGDEDFPNNDDRNVYAEEYRDGLPTWDHTIIRPEDHGPLVTVRAISTQEGRQPSSIVTSRFRFQVAVPVISSDNPGNFTIETGTRGAELFYTTDGSVPTPTSTPYVPGEQLNVVNGTNDVVFRVRGFKDGYASAEKQKVFNFEDLETSTIGFTQDYQAGIGSTLVVPVELKLASNTELRSLQFRAEVIPNSDDAPAVSTQLRNLTITTNNFIQIPVPSTNAPNATTDNYVNEDGRTVSRLAVSYVGTSSGLEMVESGTVALLAVPIPPDAQAGDSYTLSLKQPSGTSDGRQNHVFLVPFNDRTITVVEELPYLVGDTAFSTGYNAGEFGDQDLNNNDVNNAFNASFGLFVPYSFSDVFDAMDAFPLDASGTVGGDGQIRFLDWQVVLQRSLRIDPNNWTRSWVAGGSRAPSNTNLNSSPLVPSESELDGVEGRVWLADGEIHGEDIGQAQPGSQATIPVRVSLNQGVSLAGLQFLASVEPVDGAPALDQPVEFTPARGLPAPLQVDGLPAHQVGRAWSLLENPLPDPLTGESVIGYLNVQVPANAQAGDQYEVRFPNFDGAPDLETQYEFTASSAGVWVQSDVPSVSGPSRPVRGFELNWFGSSGQRYRIESTGSLGGNDWQVEAEQILGRGRAQKFIDQNTQNKTKYYRVRNHKQ